MPDGIEGALQKTASQWSFMQPEAKVEGWRSAATTAPQIAKPVLEHLATQAEADWWSGTTDSEARRKEMVGSLSQVSPVDAEYAKIDPRYDSFIKNVRRALNDQNDLRDWAQSIAYAGPFDPAGKGSAERALTIQDPKNRKRLLELIQRASADRPTQDKVLNRAGEALKRGLESVDPTRQGGVIRSLLNESPIGGMLEDLGFEKQADTDFKQQMESARLSGDPLGGGDGVLGWAEGGLYGFLENAPRMAVGLAATAAAGPAAGAAVFAAGTQQDMRQSLLERGVPSGVADKTSVVGSVLIGALENLQVTGLVGSAAKAGAKAGLKVGVKEKIKSLLASGAKEWANQFTQETAQDLAQRAMEITAQAVTSDKDIDFAKEGSEAWENAKQNLAVTMYMAALGAGGGGAAASTKLGADKTRWAGRLIDNMPPEWQQSFVERVMSIPAIADKVNAGKSLSRKDTKVIQEYFGPINGSKQQEEFFRSFGDMPPDAAAKLFSDGLATEAGRKHLSSVIGELAAKGLERIDIEDRARDVLGPSSPISEIYAAREQKEYERGLEQARTEAEAKAAKAPKRFSVGGEASPITQSAAAREQKEYERQLAGEQRKRETPDQPMRKKLGEGEAAPITDIYAAREEKVKNAPNVLPTKLSTAEVRRAFGGRPVKETAEGHVVKIAGQDVHIRMVPQLPMDRAVSERQRGKAFTDKEWATHRDTMEVAGRFGSLKVKLPDGKETNARAILLSEAAMREGTLSHEQVHLARSLGLITPSEWAAMAEKHAKGEVNDKAIEEKIAQAVEQWKPTVKSRISKFVDRILKLVGIDRVTAEKAILALREGKVWERGDALAQTDTNLEGQPSVEARYSEVPRRPKPPLSKRSEDRAVRKGYVKAQRERSMAGLPKVLSWNEVSRDASAAIATDEAADVEYQKFLEFEELDQKDVAVSPLVNEKIILLIEKYSDQGNFDRASRLIEIDTRILSPASGRTLGIRRDPMSMAVEAGNAIRAAEFQIEHAERDLEAAKDAEARQKAQDKLDKAKESLAAAREMHNRRVRQAILRDISSLSDDDSKAVKALNKVIADKKSRKQDFSKQEEEIAKIYAANADLSRKITASLAMVGIDSAAMETLGNDPRKISQALRTISEMKSTIWDKLREYRYAAMLSGVSTQFVNTAGNLLHTTFEYTVSRSFEAGLNAMLKNPNLASFKEAVAGAKQFKRAFGRAVRNMVTSFQTESLISSAGRGEGPEGTTSRTAIKGAKGRVIRTGLRAMTAADSFISTLAAEIEVQVRAERIARGQGLKEGTAEFQEEVDSQLEDQNSPAWRDSRKEALRLAFREEVDTDSVFGKAISLGKAVQNVPFVGPAVVPFVSTPARIARTAFRLTPLNVPSALWDTAQAIKSGDQGKIAEAARAWSRIGPSGILLGVMLAMNDPEDPWLTGADEDTLEKREEAAAGNRPPNSIYIPWVGWVSYARLEPFASVLAATADLSKAFHKGTLAAYPASLLKQMNSKTYLQGVGDLFEIATGKDSAETKAAYLGSSLTISMVPNIIRGTIGAAKEDVSDRRIVSQRGQRMQTTLDRVLGNTELAPWLDMPKYDYYGRPLKKLTGPAGNAGFLFRLLGQGVYPDKDVLPADKIILKWNDTHDESERVDVSAPSRWYKEDGKYVDLTDKQYDQLARVSGQILRKILEVEIAEGQPASQHHIDIINGAMRDSRAMALEALKKQWKSGVDGAIDPEALADEAVSGDVGYHLDKLAANRPLPPGPKFGTNAERRAKLADDMAKWESGKAEALKFLSSVKMDEGEAIARYKKLLRERIRDGRLSAEAAATRLRRAKALQKKAE